MQPCSSVSYRCRFFRSGRVLALPIVLLLVATDGHAQDPILLRSDDLISERQVELTPICSLGDLDGPGGVGPFAVGTRLEDGRLLLSYPMVAGEILVFGPDCGHVTTVGREGEGPGEYGFVRQLASHDRKILVFDSRNQRRTVLSLGLEVVRTDPLVGDPLGVAVLSDSVVAYNTQIPTRDKAGIPLHILDGRAEVVRSFGDSAAAFRFDMGFGGWRRLARADDHTFWAARSTEYRIEKWSDEGVLIEVLHRDVDWFPPHMDQPRPHPEEPPMPFVSALQQDEEGRLWVLIAVPDAEWYRSVIDEGNGRYNWTDDLNGFFDTVIEVLSPRDGRVLASRRLDRYLDGFVDRHHVVSYREVDAVPRIDLWRLELQPQHRR